MLFWLIPAGLLGWYLFTRKPAAPPGGSANLLGTGAINRVTRGATLFSVPPFGNNGAQAVTSVEAGETVQNVVAPLRPGDMVGGNVRQTTPDGVEWILVRRQNGQQGFIPIALLVGVPEQLTGTMLEPGKLYQIRFEQIKLLPSSDQVGANEAIRLAMADHGFRLVGGIQTLASPPGIALPTPMAPFVLSSQGIWTGEPMNITAYLNGPLSNGRFIRITGLANVQ